MSMVLCQEQDGVCKPLESVMKCDQIVVVDKGRIIEIDQPKALIDKESVFKALVQADGSKIGLENLVGERKEISGCFICRQSFSKLQTKVQCKNCSQLVCLVFRVHDVHVLLDYE
jgi:ABC-type multidrug transport system ATPase subunit